jgi:hypothetical protein
MSFFMEDALVAITFAEEHGRTARMARGANGHKSTFPVEV